MRSRYVNVSIPLGLIKEVDVVVEGEILGFHSRAEFVKDAIRTALKELKKDSTK